MPPNTPLTSDPFTSHCLELLGTAGPARARRMFGGQGLYVDELFVGLIIEEQLYLKVCNDTRAAFEQAGCQPFVYQAKGRQVRVDFYTVPAEAMESPHLMHPWVQYAMTAALQARRRPTPAKAAPKDAARVRRKPMGSPAPGQKSKSSTRSN